MARTLTIGLLTCTVGLFVAGCPFKDSSPAILQTDIQASLDVNPNAAGRPSPVVVRLYELKSLKKFDAAGFFDLYEQGSEVLGADMLNWSELRLSPGQKQEVEVTLHPETRHVGILVAYRAIEQADWRASVEVAPYGTQRFVIDVDKLSVLVSPG